MSPLNLPVLEQAPNTPSSRLKSQSPEVEWNFVFMRETSEYEAESRHGGLEHVLQTNIVLLTGHSIMFVFKITRNHVRIHGTKSGHWKHMLCPKSTNAYLSLVCRDCDT